MKTQIKSLINGSENTIRDLSSKKYDSNVIGFFSGKHNVPQNGGTTTNERIAIARAVANENPTEMHALARGIKFTLARKNSISGKSWSWETEITTEQYKILTGEDAPVWTHKNAVNRYNLVISQNCEVAVYAYSGKKGFYRILGEEFITIL